MEPPLLFGYEFYVVAGNFYYKPHLLAYVEPQLCYHTWLIKPLANVPLSKRYFVKLKLLYHMQFFQQIAKCLVSPIIVVS